MKLLFASQSYYIRLHFILQLFLLKYSQNIVSIFSTNLLRDYIVLYARKLFQFRIITPQTLPLSSQFGQVQPSRKPCLLNQYQPFFLLLLQCRWQSHLTMHCIFLQRKHLLFQISYIVLRQTNHHQWRKENCISRRLSV